MGHKWKLLPALAASLVLVTATPADTTLRFKNKPGSRLDYVIKQDQKMAMQAGGKDIDIKTGMFMKMAWETKKVDENGNAHIKATIGQVKMSMEGGPFTKIEIDSKDTKESDNPVGKMFGQVIKAMAGMEMTFTLTPNGEMKDTKFSEEALKKLKAIPGANQLGGNMLSPESLKSMMAGMALPKEAIEKGKSWTQKTDSKTPLGNMIGTMKYTYEGQVEKNGKKLEKMAIKPEFKFEPSDSAPVKMKIKDSTGKGHVLFDNEAGRIVETTTETTMNMEIEAGGMTLNQKVVQTMTLRLADAGK